MTDCERLARIKSPNLTVYILQRLRYAGECGITPQEIARTSPYSLESLRAWREEDGQHLPKLSLPEEGMWKWTTILDAEDMRLWNDHDKAMAREKRK